MKLRHYIWLMLILSLAGCYSDDFFEINKDAFYKLYGNGTLQEAVTMHLGEEGEVYVVGNQYVRNQDSSAVVLIKTDAAGNQLWSERYPGRGFNLAKTIVSLPSGDLLLLSATRATNQAGTIPVLYRIDKEGELLQEYLFEKEENKRQDSRVPEDMVPGEDGTVFILGNIRNSAGGSDRSFIEKIDLRTGELLDQREFRNAAMTEARRIMRVGNQLLVIGNTLQEVAEMKEQNIFLAPFAMHLVEAGLMVMGSPQNDSFKKAILNVKGEVVVLSSQQNSATDSLKGVLHFVNPKTFRLRNTLSIEYAAKQMPEAIEEDEDGNLYIAFTNYGERGNTNILIDKIDLAGSSVWGHPKEIGGEGNDRIAGVKLKSGYAYLLKTIDMQNENTLISLSKIRL